MTIRCTIELRSPDPHALAVRGRNSTLALRFPWRAASSTPPPDDRTVLLAISTESAGEQPAWMPAVRREFEAGLPEVELWAVGRPLAVWPTSTGVISDVPSLLSFIRARPGWRFILEPLAVLTEAMRGSADEHLRRMAEALEEHPALAGLVLPRRDDSLRGLVERAFDGLSPDTWVAEWGTSAHLH